MLDTNNVLWYSSLAVQLLFCMYLAWTRLAKIYPAFTICLGSSVVRALAAIYFMRGAVGSRLPLTYTYFWLWTEPFWLLLQVAVALEVHAKMWKEYSPVLRQTRPLLLFALLMALVSAGIPVRIELARAGASRLIATMHFEFLVTRYVSSVLAIFLVLSATLFFVVVRNASKSSIFRHEGMLAAYFGVYAMAAFLIDMGWAKAVLVNGYLASGLTLCFLAWFSVLKPQSVPGE